MFFISLLIPYLNNIIKKMLKKRVKKLNDPFNRPVLKPEARKKKLETQSGGKEEK